MSVLACDRRGCKNVLCDRLSYNHGYICEECFHELVMTGAETNIEKFMATAKRNDVAAAQARFNIEFSLEDPSYL